ncbi:MAG: hypothetical protein JXA07_09175 [Spirochaetes bacterium]|nr:hypothetical protein [Spirochaetota bacterium]
MPDPQNIFDSSTVSTILKWAVMILITGFIAQFGKQFATFILGKIRNIRNKKAGGEPGAKAAGPAPAASGDAAEKARLKLEKKLAKAAAKERKKKS